MSKPEETSIRLLRDLRSRYPDTPFLALGQTVWWDEPMKAVLKSWLDSADLGGRMVLGVHDTDYFAKVRVRQAGQSRFELMPHNDGSTKELWSAAGEVSRLFGSETYPTHHDFVEHGVPFNRLARASGRDRLAFLNEVTEAWGWRGLVYTGSRDLIVHSLPLRDMGDAVEEMLRYGFNGTAASIVDECCRREAMAIGHRLLAWVTAYRAANPDATLSDLYQHLFPRLFELMLCRSADNVEVTCTASLLRFCPETARLPRFAFVDLFLNESTRQLALDAYNHAVAGSETYQLDRFGLGALPFDLIIPGHGRGTLRVTLRAIHVETRNPIRIPIKRPITSVVELADYLAAEFGDQVTLVGKAITLISMLSREFIFVFNEEGSTYVHRTRRMNDLLRANGIDLPLHPILRLRYATWEALEVGRSTIQLPRHLAAAFSKEQIPAGEFAGCWRAVADSQRALLDEIKPVRRPRELMQLLLRVSQDDWPDQLARYESETGTLLRLRNEAELLDREVRSRYDRLRAVKQEIRDTERSMSAHFHATESWTEGARAERGVFEAALKRLLDERRELRAQIQRLKADRWGIERGAEAVEAREAREQAIDRAETARLHLVRNALLTCAGLAHTQHRPSAWWLPMLDPYGHWFRRIVETTKAYTEPVVSESPPHAIRQQGTSS